MTKEVSKTVTTNQNGIHDDLKLIVSKQSLIYQRPIADFSIEIFNDIQEITKGKKIIFDFGCGVGESTYKLALRNPEYFVVGIDKSISRLDRKNRFKQEIVENMLLVRGELLDLIYLIYKAYKSQDMQIHVLYFFYPNPWPKKIHVKRRFHGNPIAPFIYSIDVPIILRSNWKLYLEEFSFVSALYKRQSQKIKTLEVIDALTPFERKYTDSAQEVYELTVL